MRVSWPPRVFLSGQAASLLGDGLAVLAIPLPPWPRGYRRHVGGL